MEVHPEILEMILRDNQRELDRGLRNSHLQPAYQPTGAPPTSSAATDSGRRLLLSRAAGGTRQDVVAEARVPDHQPLGH